MRLLTLILVLLLTGCSGVEKQQANAPAKSPQHSPASAGKSTDSTHKMTFKRQQRYGSTDKVIVGEIASFTVDNKKRVFIADEKQTTIQVFNPDGSYRTSLGRQGNGPAEFAAINPNTIIKIRSNRLYVPDYTNSYGFFPTRVQVFDLSKLAFIHTVKLIAGNRSDYRKELARYFPKELYPLGRGRFLVGYHRARWEYKDSTSFIRYVVQDSTDNIIRGPILQQKDLTNLVYFNKKAKIPYLAVSSFPFFGKSLLALSGDNHLYAASSEKFNIDVYNLHGTYIRSIRQPFSNRKLSRNQLISLYRQKNDTTAGKGVDVNMIRQARNLPDHWPALHSMLFDDKDRLWVATIIDNDNVYQWWVLKKTGEVVTKFNWPREKPIKMVRNGYLYTIETAKKTGLKEIVRYLIVEKG